MIQDNRVIQCQRCLLSAKPAHLQVSPQTALAGQCPPSATITLSAQTALHSESQKAALHSPPAPPGKRSWAEQPNSYSPQAAAQSWLGRAQQQHSQQGCSGTARTEEPADPWEKPGGEGIAEHLGQEAEKDLSNSPGRVWRRLQQEGDRGTSEMNL